MTAVAEMEYKSEFKPQKAPHTSPWRSSYGVTFLGWSRYNDNRTVCD